METEQSFVQFLRDAEKTAFPCRGRKKHVKIRMDGRMKLLRSLYGTTTPLLGTPIFDLLVQVALMRERPMIGDRLKGEVPKAKLKAAMDGLIEKRRLSVQEHLAPELGKLLGAALWGMDPKPLMEVAKLMLKLRDGSVLKASSRESRIQAKACELAAAIVPAGEVPKDFGKELATVTRKELKRAVEAQHGKQNERVFNRDVGALELRLKPDKRGRPKATK